MEKRRINNIFPYVSLQWFGGSKAPVYASGNIDNATRSLSNTVNTPVVGWDKTADFIVAIALEAVAAASIVNTNCRLEWRNKTDGGTFAVFSSSGELRLGATDLVEGNSLISGEAICTPVNGTTYIAGSPNGGVEKETGSTFTVGDASTINQWSEFQISVDASNALDGKEYEFRVYDVDNSAILGPSLATLKIYGEVIRYVDPDATGAGTGVDWTNAYTSLNAWEAAEETDLVADGQWHHLWCSSTGGTADTIDVVINGWTTGVNNYILVKAASGDGADANGWDTAKYRLIVPDDVALGISELYVRVDNLQIQSNAATTNSYGIYIQGTGGGVYYISNCRIISTDNSGGIDRGMYLSEALATFNIWNCISTGHNDGIIVINAAAANIYNCTIYGNVSDGIEFDAGIGTVKNCAVFANGYDFDIAAGATVTIDYCASDDNDGTNNVAESGGGAAWPDDFEGAATGDFRLKSGSNLVDAATYNPGSGLYSDDIEGTDRGASNWDVGAYEYVASGTTHQLVGSVDSVSLLSGGINVKRSIAGSSDSVSLLSGVLDIDIKLLGSADSISLLSAALGVRIPIAGSADSISLLSGDLSVITKHQLVGSTDSISLLSGSINLTKDLIGSSDSVSLLSGGIDIAIKLLGTSDSVSLLSGGIDLDIKLVGSTDSISLLSGDLTISGVPTTHYLVGSVDSVSLLSGAININRLFAGSADSISLLSGVLDVDILLIGSVDSISLLSGLIKIINNITGSTDSVSLLSGSINIDQLLNGSADSISLLSGTLDILGGISLEGLISSASLLSGSINLTKDMSGSVDSISLLSGSLFELLFNQAFISLSTKRPGLTATHKQPELTFKTKRPTITGEGE